jgi:hypothetical protein
MTNIIAGKISGVQITVANEDTKKQWQALHQAATGNGNYWAMTAVKTILSLNSGQFKQSVYIPEQRQHLDGRSIYKVIMPGCAAIVRHQSTGQLCILQMKSSAEFGQLQVEYRKPAYFEINGEGRNLEIEQKHKVSKPKTAILVCDRHQNIENAIDAAKAYLGKAPNTSTEGGYGIMYTPDENPVKGIKSILSVSRSLSTDRDPKLKESAQVLYHLMKNSRQVEYLTWVTEWGGSGIMYQAMRRFSRNTQEFNERHKMFFAAPTTNVKAIEELAEANGIRIERNSRYFDGLNPTQMLGSGRLAGGNFGAAWRRLRSDDENSYNIANFGSDVYRETKELAWSTYGHVATSNKVLQLTGALGASTAATSPNTVVSVIGLGLAVVGAGGAAFQSFFPRTYHKTMEKFN